METNYWCLPLLNSFYTNQLHSEKLLLYEEDNAKLYLSPLAADGNSAVYSCGIRGWL